jgi:hypothetical protein
LKTCTTTLNFPLSQPSGHRFVGHGHDLAALAGTGPCVGAWRSCALRPKTSS